MATSTYVEDGRNAGKRGILKSPNVCAAPPSVNRPIPVPSVYEDARGEIHNLRVGGSRYNLLYTRKGVMRSGDIHENTQHDFVFRGRVEVWRLQPDGTTDKTIYSSFDYIRIDPYVPHVFHFLENCVMAEWWEPQGFYAWFYEPYRKLVQQSIQPKQPGRFLLLKPDDEEKDRVANILMVGSGLAVGLVAGYFLGMRYR